MSDLASSRNYIQAESVQTREPTGESLLQRIGGSVNSLLDTVGENHQFKLNGNFTSAIQEAVDGALVFDYNATIYDTQLYLYNGGVSGVLSIDLQYSADRGLTWTSIYTTKPSIDFTAAIPTYVGVGDTVAACVAPVFTSVPFNVVKGGWLRCDVISTQVMNRNGGIIVKYRPRN